MRSVPSRFSEPSTAVRMFAGLESSTPGPSPACETRPNFVATTTSSRRPFEGAADEFLVGVGAVDLGGVDVGDAQVECPLDGADRFGVAAVGVEVVAGHRHRAESDARDVKSAERNVLHDMCSCGRREMWVESKKARDRGK